MRYLMLNPEDITDVIGEVNDAQVRSELHLTPSQLNFKISRNAPFYKGCVLIEKEFREVREERFFDEVMIAENDNGSRWYATKDCHIYRVYKNGKKKNLSIWNKRGKYETRVNNHVVNAARVFAKCFVFPDLDKNYSVVVNGELELENLQIVPMKKVKQSNGFMSSEGKRKKIGLYKKGKLVQSWPSSRKAGKDLFLSHQAVRDICDGKVKKKIYDLRYIQ